MWRRGPLLSLFLLILAALSEMAGAMPNVALPRSASTTSTSSRSSSKTSPRSSMATSRTINSQASKSSYTATSVTTSKAVNTQTSKSSTTGSLTTSNIVSSPTSKASSAGSSNTASSTISSQSVIDSHTTSKPKTGTVATTSSSISSPQSTSSNSTSSVGTSACGSGCSSCKPTYTPYDISQIYGQLRLTVDPFMIVSTTGSMPSSTSASGHSITPTTSKSPSPPSTITSKPSMTTGLRCWETGTAYGPSTENIGVSTWCTCNDGYTRDSSTSTQSGSTYGVIVCPTDARIIGSQQHIYTITSGLEVDQCFTEYVETYFNSQHSPTSSTTYCIGTSNILQASPTMSVIASTGEGALVGSLTGSMLVTSISDAIMAACTGISTGGTCNPTATISSVEYPDPSREPGLNVKGMGEVEITWGGGMIVENTTMLSRMAGAIGMTAAHYINSTDGACHDVQLDQEELHSIVPTGKILLCTIPNSIMVEWYDGIKRDGPADRLWVSFTLATNGGHSLDALEILEEVCEGALGALEFLTVLLDFVYPPASALALEATEIVTAACGTVKDGIDDANSVVGRHESVGYLTAGR